MNAIVKEDANPFGSKKIAERETAALVAVEQSRAIAETQAAMFVAKKFPRDERQAVDRILNACARPGLAEQSLYTYSRGGTEITGPSIRLAEALAQNWGNVQFGIRELEQRAGESTVEAFAWDIETNVRQTKTFQVPHKRYTKKGSYALEDPRDIYEMVANQGARRLRACILGVIPGDVIEAAVGQCDLTLRTKAEVTPERLKSLLEKFAEFGVTKEQIEARIQRNLEAMTPAQMVDLGKKYNSLKDGMSAVGDWFEVAQATETQSTSGSKLKEAAAAAAARATEHQDDDLRQVEEGGNGGDKKPPAAPEAPEGARKEPEPLKLEDVLGYITKAASRDVALEALDLARGLSEGDQIKARAAFDERFPSQEGR